MKKVAIFVDWENVRHGIFERSNEKVGKRIDYNEIENIIHFITAFIDSQSEEIYRIFIYLSEPFSGTVNNIDYTQTPSYIKGMELIRKLRVQDYVALRMGKVVFRGLKSNGQPSFEQKQVDMLLGLDVAHVAHYKLADRALVLSTDTDMIPAMKEARIHGLQVIVGYCADVQGEPAADLRAHADFTREHSFLSIFP